MNVTLAVVLILLLLFAYRGHRKGIAMEIASLVSALLSLAGLSLIIRMIESYMKDNVNDIVQALVFFVALAFLYEILKFVILSLKILTKIPVIHWLNSFVGMIFGLAEGILLIWVLLIALSKYDIAGQSAVILEQVSGNPFLSFLKEKNPLLRFF